jgi:DNA topoisomerase I
MKIVVIVESSTKAKSIEQYLNAIDPKNEYKVVACYGHICDLVKDKNYGIHPETFVPIYEYIKSNMNTINKLKSLNSKADKVLLASDNDREGEIIAWHLKQVLNPKRYERIVFNEITMDALRYAISHAKDIDMKMVNAQQTRRVFDRLIGFRLTKTLWNEFSMSSVLTAGRVQSVVLMVIIQKEREILKFITERYWNVINNFKYIENTKLYDANKNDTLVKITDQKTLTNLLKVLLQQNYYMKSDSSEVKKRIENSSLPFTTSTLQQKAFSKGFSIKSTMSIAQELYEKGCITYMRTDSTTINESMKQNIYKYITDTYGQKYVCKKGGVKGKTQTNAQEAHEAIRPTNLSNTSDIIGNKLKLGPRHKLLYELIFERTIAAFMIPAVYNELNVKIYHEKIEKNLYFLGKLKVLIEPGWKKAIHSEIGTETENETDVNKSFVQILDKLKRKITSIEVIGNCVWTLPPTRYNESTIIKYMETNGIGRPSTYVSILNKLYDRKYLNANESREGPVKEYLDYIASSDTIKERVEKRPTYSEKNKIVPTDIGIQISDFLSTNFKEVVNVDFTNQLETKLDKIANGEETYDTIIRKFHDFIIQRTNLPKKSKDEKKELKVFNKTININKLEYIIRVAKFGPVIQYKNKDGSKDIYINLKPYLQMKKSTIDKINAKDIEFLLSFPKKILNGKYIVDYKSYGFFVKDVNTDVNRSIKYNFHDIEKNNYEFVPKLFLNKTKEKKTKH